MSTNPAAAWRLWTITDTFSDLRDTNGRLFTLDRGMTRLACEFVNLQMNDSDSQARCESISCGFLQSQYNYHFSPWMALRVVKMLVNGYAEVHIAEGAEMDGLGYPQAVRKLSRAGRGDVEGLAIRRFDQPAQPGVSSNPMLEVFDTVASTVVAGSSSEEMFRPAASLGATLEAASEVLRSSVPYLRRQAEANRVWHAEALPRVAWDTIAAVINRRVLNQQPDNGNPPSGRMPNFEAAATGFKYKSRAALRDGLDWLRFDPSFCPDRDTPRLFASLRDLARVLGHPDPYTAELFEEIYSALYNAHRGHSGEVHWPGGGEVVLDVPPISPSSAQPYRRIRLPE